MPATTSRYRILTGIFFAICYILLATSPLAAEIIEIPLTGLHGTYMPDGIAIRSDSLFLDRIPTEISNVSFKIVGTGINGLMDCDLAGIGGCRSLGIHWVVTLEDTTTIYMWLPINQGSHTIEEEPLALIFDMNTNNSWFYLLSGECTIVMQAQPWPYPFGANHCSWCDYPFAEISGVWLLVDGTFTTGVEESSWGTIKALVK